MTDLRDWLKAHNIKNSMGGEMSYNTIQRMLSNRRYIGELRLRDVVQPNAIPVLVSEELFNKVQEKLAKNKKAPARHMNCTPFVRQYGILFRKWGVFVCQRDNESTTERRR